MDGKDFEFGFKIDTFRDQIKFKKDGSQKNLNNERFEDENFSKNCVEMSMGITSLEHYIRIENFT